MPPGFPLWKWIKNKAVAGVGMGMNELKRMQTSHSENNAGDHRKLEVTLEWINERTERHASQIYYG